MGQDDITEDALLGRRIRVRQPARGYRVNVDTLLLAAAISADDRGVGPVIELGCGVGAGLIAVAQRHHTHANFVGLERDPLYARLARENATLNGLEERVTIIEGDLFAPPEGLTGFAHVFFNPPYDDPSEGRAPAAARQGAHMEERPIGDWVKIWSNRVAGDATLTLIHRAQRLPDILAALEGRLGGVEIFPIRPNAKAKASRVILRATKGSRAPLTLLPGLDLHPENGAEKYTPEAHAILRGDAFIRFG